jgi:hypothetical protein
MSPLTAGLELEQAELLAELLANTDAEGAGRLGADRRQLRGMARFVAALLQAGVDRDLVLGAMTDEERRRIFAQDPDRRARAWAAAKTWQDLRAELAPISWSWDRWLINGMLTMLVAEPGAGKSALCLRLARTYILGDPWPDGTPYAGKTGKVLWCEAEAAQALNLQRADQWGLPAEELLLPLDDPLSEIALDNTEHMRRVEELAAHPQVRMVVVDSLRGANSGDENSSETMGVVKRLAQLARDVAKPVVLTHHLRKRGIQEPREGITLDRVRGSSAIVQPARVIWAIDTPDAGKKDVRRLSVIKSNVSAPPAPLGMTIGEHGIVIQDAPEPSRRETLQSQATALLLGLLAAGPKRATELREEVESAGISWSAAQRASQARAEEGLDAASAGSRVGYHGAADFSRELKSLFTDPPFSQVQRLREQAA